MHTCGSAGLKKPLSAVHDRLGLIRKRELCVRTEVDPTLFTKIITPIS